MSILGRWETDEFMEVICASADCKHIDDESCCRLRKIALSECYIHTINEGVQHLWRCKQYEQSAYSKRLEEQFVKLLEEQGMEVIK